MATISGPPFNMPTPQNTPKPWYFAGEDTISQEFVEDYSLPVNNDGTFGDVDVFNLRPPQRTISLRGEGFTEHESHVWALAAQTTQPEVNVETVDEQEFTGWLKSFRRTCIMGRDPDGRPLYEVEIQIRVAIPANPT